MSVQFTPGQLRNAASISPETYRHWKKKLDPLRRARGHSPCFTAGDLVAVAVVRTLCLDLSIRVGTLAPIAYTLFDICNSLSWPVLERGMLVVDIPHEHLEFRSEIFNTFGERALVMVPLRLIVVQLRDQLLSISQLNEQQTLRFPPNPVAAPLASKVMRVGRERR